MDFGFKPNAEATRDFMNYIPFVSLAIKEAPTPMVTQVMQPVIIAVVLGFFMEIKTIPELKMEISTVKNQVGVLSDENKQLRGDMQKLTYEIKHSLEETISKKMDNNLSRKEYEDVEGKQSRDIQALKDTISMQRNQQR